MSRFIWRRAHGEAKVEIVNKTNTRRSPKVDERQAPYHHGDLRDALVQAAQRILETDGLAALSLRAVARRAGVSPAAPYHHFPDKQALLDAVAECGFDALTAAMTTRMERVTGSAARLDASGIGYVAFAVANPALFGLMFGTVGQNPSAGTSLDLARQRAYAVLQEAVAACSPSGKASAAECVRLWALVHGIAKLVLEDCIKPADFGLRDGEALAAHLLRC
jgi:AcrR family transcriptional regulator